jgi:hypothetical protein
MKTDSRLKYCWWYLKCIYNFIIFFTSKYIDTYGPYFGLDCGTRMSNYSEEQLLMVLKKDEGPEEWGNFFFEPLLTVSGLRLCTPKRLS